MRDDVLKIALLHDQYDESRLDAVKTVMLVRGRPIIKAVWADLRNTWLALEGGLRLRAAAELGVLPIIEAVHFDPEISLKRLQLDYPGCMTLGDLLDHSHHSTVLYFDLSEPKFCQYIVSRKINLG
ncbi:MAG: hypothetical protein M3Q07_02300 [Pseudobdellovibrionaceae bacterium]|nr:hypothetical protein [Pseudobdellovibrionaceae bacterium]